MEHNIKYNCVFGGGGIRGMCYIGAVKALQECEIEIESIAGSSVGAVFASLFAVGYKAEEIKELFFDFNFNMFRDININLFNADISLSKGEIFLDWLREKIGKKILKNNYNKNSKVRFKDIECDLQILTIDINTNTPFIFSKENTPDEEIAFAVRISAGLPGLMKPINIGDSILVDGDLIKSWPAWKIYNSLNSSDTRLLEFRLEGSRDGSDIKNPMDYVNSIINTIWYLSTENVFNEYHQNDRYDFIIIDAKDIILFDFTIDKEIKEKLIDKGYHVTKEYLTSTLVSKKKEILSVYKSIHKKLNIAYKILLTKKYDNLIIVINEILSTMNEDSKYIDISIYKKIKELKESILINTKKGFLFTTKIDNEKQIKERAEFIIMLIEERIEDIYNYIKKYCNKC